MKTIILTGASSGIGKAAAHALQKAGHQIILASRNEEKLQDLKISLGKNVHVVVTDVCDYAQVQHLINDTLRVFGTIDVLVNNAGVGYFDKVVDGRIEDWHHMVDVNVNGVLNCIHAALPHLISTGGQVVNIASVAAHNVFVNSGIYCGTKHAVFAFSEALRMELAGKIRVSTLSPGAVNTAFIDNTHTPEMLTEYRDYFASSMNPDLVAEQIVRLVDAPDGVVISEIVIRPHRSNK
ncbi:MAG: SDR family oxidoreductase [Flavobacteriales bacterium]|nr:SDR family oxidoreductase [Flavobacteriales bacterium]